MGRAQLTARLAVEANAAFEENLAAGLARADERAGFIEAWVHDSIQEAEYDAACDREAFGLHEPEDTPCVQSADIWGTGEGRYHGVIG